MTLWSIPVLVLLLLGQAPAAIQQRISLTPSVAEGDRFLYRMDITVFLPPDEWPFGDTTSGVLRVLVKRFRPGSELRLVFTMDGIQKVITARFDGRGRLESIRAITFDGTQIEPDGGFDGLVQPGEMPGFEKQNQQADIIANRFLFQFLQVITPDHPVQPGESWTSTVQNPVAPLRPVNFRSTYIGRTMLRGVSVLEVQQIGVMATDDSETPGLMTARSRFWLNPKTRAIVSAEARLAGLPQPGGNTIWATFKLTAVPDAAR